MKIHTKHLALCEKGGKFNKTHNTIYKLQEELIEPTGTMGGFFYFHLIVFSFSFSFWLILESTVTVAENEEGKPKRRSRNLLSLAKMKFSPVFLFTLLSRTGY